MSAPAVQVPKKLREGLRVQMAPALPRGYQIKCDGCHCSVSLDHVPCSADCEEARRERLDSQRDW